MRFRVWFLVCAFLDNTTALAMEQNEQDPVRNEIIIEYHDDGGFVVIGANKLHRLNPDQSNVTLIFQGMRAAPVEHVESDALYLTLRSVASLLQKLDRTVDSQNPEKS